MARRLDSLPELSEIDIDRRLFNEIYYPLLSKVYAYMVLYGGSGSGKSHFLGQLLAIQMTILPGRNLVCLRKQKTDCIKSCWAFVYNALKRFKLLKYWQICTNPDHKMINRINGNEILFEGVDNIEDIKSIQFTNKAVEDENSNGGGANLTDVWYEEVNAEENREVIEELDRRLRDTFVQCRIILSFNPVSRSHWLFDYVTNFVENSPFPHCVLKTTYKDNRFLQKDYGIKMELLKNTNPYAYQVYALGNWGTMGQTVFDANKIQNRLNELNEKYSKEMYIRGTFIYEEDEKGIPLPNTYQFVETPLGKVSIYKRSEDKIPYVLSADTAGEGKDFYIGMVRNNTTGEQVAVFRDNGNPDLCVWQIYGLAKMYNDALFGPEINFNGWIIKAFRMLGYRNFYNRVSAADSKREVKEGNLGWRTGPENRQLMLTEFQQWSGSFMHLINDVETLNEMLLFTYQEKKLKGIWMGAEPGAHDDLVIAFAILLQICSQQSCEVQPSRKQLEGMWTRFEIDQAISDGRIDKLVAQEYIENNGCAYESAETRYLLKQKQGGSRYARR